MPKPKRLRLSDSKPTGHVTILIPFRDNVFLLHSLLQSLRQSTWPHYDVILIDNGSTCRATLQYLQQFATHDRFRVVSLAEPFHFPRLCNYGAGFATGNYLLFLNNDMEVLSPDWIEQLLRVAQLPRVGAVGATLLYPNDTLQHVGIFPSVDDRRWSHVYRGRPADFPGDHGELHHPRETPAVTGACMLVRRELFQQLGGFSEYYPVTGNDVDLCQRIRELGLAVGVTPHARLMHYESLTRGYSIDQTLSSPIAPPYHV